LGCSLRAERSGRQESNDGARRHQFADHVYLL
jgi:hypothetical protein